MIPDHHEPQAAYRSYDGLFRYSGPTGHAGRCYLHVYEAPASLPVVIAWETRDNPGASVTNAAASIATQAWRQLLPRAKEGIMFIEAYVDPHHTHLTPGERFAEVTFDLAHGPDGDALRSPRWRPRERADVERLIGGPVQAPIASSY